MSWIISRALLALYESSHSSPGQAAGFWEVISSDGAPSAQSNGSLTPPGYWCSGRTTESSPRSPFGTTYEALTGDRGKALLTWFLEGFLARTFPLPAKVQASPVLAADYGLRWRGLSARWNHDMYSWKTPPSLWDEGWRSSLQTLPRWGSMRDGVLWERVTLARLTNATESGYLPTPVKYDSHGTWESNNYHGLGWSAKNDPDRLTGKGLGRVARMWPTPVKNEDRAAAYTLETSRRHFLDSSHQVHLAQAVRDPAMHPARARGPGPNGTWPTPTCTQPKMPTETLRKRMQDGQHDGNTSVPLIEVLQRQTLAEHDARIRKRLPTPTATNGLRNSGKGGPTDGSEHYPTMWQSPGHPEYGELNPDWEEWIMGWPIGWTSIEPMNPAAFDAWFILQSADPLTGFGRWWLQDPSELEDAAVCIPKTVKPKSDADDEIRKHRIAAIGNGQVSAVVCASTNQMSHWRMPAEGEDDACDD